MHTASRPRTIAAAFAVALASWLVVTAVVPAVAADAPTAAADADVTWSVRPADDASGEPRQNYSFELDPGRTIRDAVVVANYDDAPIVLDVYAADGFTTKDGHFDVATRDVAPQGVGAWIIPDVDRVTIPSGAAVEIPFTLTLPQNATPGDHAGAILTSLRGEQQDSGLNVDRRLGIRIQLRVGGDLAPALVVDDLRLGYAGTPNPIGAGTATATYVVRNSGNVRLEAGQRVRVAGPFGLFGVTADDVDPVPALLPGETWTVEVPVSGVLPSFLLTATVDLAPSAPAGVEAAPATITATATAWAVPWALLVVIVALAGAVVLVLWLRRKRRAERARQEDARVQAAVALALRERDADNAAAGDAEALPEKADERV